LNRDHDKLAACRTFGVHPPDGALTLYVLFFIVPVASLKAVLSVVTTEMQQEQFYKGASATASAPVNRCDLTETPQCCGTGCAVCVLDYPELFSQSPADPETLAMLEAIEQAQLQAAELLAETGGELQ